MNETTIKRIMAFLYENKAPFCVEEIQALKMAMEHMADCDKVGEFWQVIAMKMCGK